MTRLEFSSPQARTAYRVGQLFTFLTLVFLAGYAGLLITGHTEWQVWVTFGAVVLTTAGSLACVQLSRSGRHETGIHVLLFTVFVTVIAVSLLIENIGTGLAAAIVVLTLSLSTATLPQRQTTPIFFVSLGTALFATAMDIITIPWHLALPNAQIYTLAVSTGVTVLFAIALARQFSRYTLTNKLLIGFIALALITSLGQGALTQRNLTEVISASTQQALLGVAQQVSADIDGYLRSNLAIVQSAAQVPLLAEYLQLPQNSRPLSSLDSNVNQFLRNLRGADLKNISGYLLLDAEGRVVKDTTGYMYPYSAATTYAQRDFFTQPRDSLEAYISLPQFSIKPNPATPYIYLAAPVVNPRDNTFLGMVAARYRADALQTRIAAFNGRLGEHSFAALYVPLEGNYAHLAHGTRPELMLTLVAPESASHLVSLQNRGYLSLPYMSTLSIEDLDLFTAITNAVQTPFFSVSETYAPLPLDPDDNPSDESYRGVAVQIQSTGWLVTYYQLQSSFTASLNTNVRNNQFAGLVIIALATLSAVFFTQVLTRPINHLSQVAQALTAGDLKARAAVQSEDEIGRLARTFNQMAEQLNETLSSMEQRIASRTADAERRSAQVQAAAEVGRIANQIREIDRLLPQVTELISTRFGFYHVGIFLLDERGEYAVLSASNSLGGQRMLARGHKLKVGQVGIVGYVTSQRKARIALDVGEDAVFFNNPDLPNTRSEMAIPLISGDEVLGALDVQSTQPGAFSDEDIEIMQLLADQITVAISNARLFARNQQALEDIRRAYGEVAQRAWFNLLNSRQSLGYAQVADKILPIQPAWDAIGLQALREARPIASPTPDERGRYRLTLPVYTTDVPLGIITAFKDNAPWLETEIELLTGIVQELSLTLENSRLFEESQRRAQLERASAHIVTRLRETLDIQAMLRTAANEIRQALALPEVSVRLTPAAEQNPGNGNDTNGGRDA
ncbi:MAG: hypothetical protein Fur0018_12600 [Anaerolineales bacterium]